MSLHFGNTLACEALSFTVYSLKQMVTAGTISVSTAWSLFHNEWRTIDRTHSGNVEERRTLFLMRVRNRVEETELTADKSLQEFEFWARAGEAGLAQYERYGQWAEALVFDEATCADMNSGVRDEYRKALWLEMRLIEGQVGFAQTNYDVGKFILPQGSAAYYRGGEKRAVECRVDLYTKSISSQVGATLDSSIKAEIGHWMFDLFSTRYDWVSELMDRMNIAGYTARVAQAFEGELSREELAMEALVFLEGGFYLSSEKLASGAMIELEDGALWKTDKKAPKAAFPVTPNEFPASRMESTEEHEVAEYVEREIRRALAEKIRRGDSDLDPAEVYQTYRKVGVYIAILNLEQHRTKEEIVEILDNLDLTEVEEYYVAWQAKVYEANAVAARSSSRIAGARALAFFAGELEVHDLEELLEDSSLKVQGYAAEGLLRLGVTQPGSYYHDYLTFRAAYLHRDWKTIAALEKNLEGITATIFAEMQYEEIEQLFDVLKKVDKPIARRIMKLALNTEENYIRYLVLERLAEMKGGWANFALFRSMLDNAYDVRSLARQLLFKGKLKLLARLALFTFTCFQMLGTAAVTRLRSLWRSE